jgi:hypothetical protein
MPERESNERSPAAKKELSCHEMVRSLYMKANYNKDLRQALVDKKLLKFSNRFVTVQHPRMDWINRVRSSLNKSIKNWNNNKYPAFYIFSSEDVVPHAKQYFETINSMVSPDMAVAPDATKNFETINLWIKAFTDYEKDIDHLLEERISLQYNLSLLKKLKIKDEIKDIKLTIKRNGELVTEVVTLRKSDKDQDFYIKKLKKEITDLDGTTLSNGRIKDRIIRQAMLNDMITILQREFEYGLKNAESPSPELVKELKRLNKLLKNSHFEPTTYGIYRINNKVFIRELIALSKLDVAYKKFVESPLLQIKEIAEAFIQNRPFKKDPTDEIKKIGILKRVYAKITSITLKQAAIGTGIAATAAFGVDRFFLIQEPEVTEIGGDTDHQEQLNRTKEEAVKKGDDYSNVIEIHIDELTE